MADQNNLFTLKIITPSRVFYEGEVSMVEFNTTEGEIGVLKKHVPTTQNFLNMFQLFYSQRHLLW